MLECSIKERGEFTDELGNETKLIYSIVTGKVTLGGIAAETYGVSIAAECKDKVFIETVEDITPCLAEITELIKKLRDFQVTPITLKDIINDYVEN